MQIEIDTKAYCFLSAITEMGLPCPLAGNSVSFTWFEETKFGIFRGITETNCELRLSIQTGFGTYCNVRPRDVISIGKLPEESLWKHPKEKK